MHEAVNAVTDPKKADGTPQPMTVAEIAWVCHEANRAYCQTQGDDSQPSWEAAPNWQRMSAIKGVMFCQANPDAPASSNHESWLKEKKDAGWVYGPNKNPDAHPPTHPCFVNFDQLPMAQQRKDYLFKAVVAALSH